MQDAAVILRWSCLVLEQLQLPAAAKAATRIIAAQAGPLETLSASQYVPWAAVVRPLNRLLTAKPALLTEYIAAAQSTGGVFHHFCC